jgi:hypothetical protein
MSRYLACLALGGVGGVVILALGVLAAERFDANLLGF